MAQLATNAPLAANAIWRPANPIDTGEGVIGAESEPTLRILVTADQAGQLGVEQSDDGVTWYTTLGPQAIAASAAFAGNQSATVYESIVALRYVRPVYVNGAAAQGRFALFANMAAV